MKSTNEKNVYINVAVNNDGLQQWMTWTSRYQISETGEKALTLIRQENIQAKLNSVLFFDKGLDTIGLQLHSNCLNDYASISHIQFLYQSVSNKYV